MYSTKNLIKATAFALAFVFVQSAAFAAAGPKVVEKARKAVESAAPDDWQTYAKSASLCFEKSVNWKEALNWAQKSVEIRKTAYNLQVLGDYYLKNKMPEKAIEYYIQSMDQARSQDINADLSTQQRKIGKADALRRKI